MIVGHSTCIVLQAQLKKLMVGRQLLKFKTVANAFSFETFYNRRCPPPEVRGLHAPHNMQPVWPPLKIMQRFQEMAKCGLQ